MTEVDYEIAKLVLEETQLELREAKARIAELVAALKQVEWVSIAGCDHAMLECPWCGMLEYSAYPSGDHEPDCHRQLALERCKDVADKKGDGLEPTPPQCWYFVIAVRFSRMRPARLERAGCVKEPLQFKKEA